jgi:hypothetical protein
MKENLNIETGARLSSNSIVWRRKEDGVTAGARQDFPWSGLGPLDDFRRSLRPIIGPAVSVRRREAALDVIPAVQSGALQARLVWKQSWVSAGLGPAEQHNQVRHSSTWPSAVGGHRSPVGRHGWKPGTINLQLPSNFPLV